VTGEEEENKPERDHVIASALFSLHPCASIRPCSCLTVLIIDDVCPSDDSMLHRFLLDRKQPPLPSALPCSVSGLSRERLVAALGSPTRFLWAIPLRLGYRSAETFSHLTCSLEPQGELSRALGACALHRPSAVSVVTLGASHGDLAVLRRELKSWECASRYSRSRLERSPHAPTMAIYLRPGLIGLARTPTVSGLAHALNRVRASSPCFARGEAEAHAGSMLLRGFWRARGSCSRHALAGLVLALVVCSLSPGRVRTRRVSRQLQSNHATHLAAQIINTLLNGGSAYASFATFHVIVLDVTLRAVAHVRDSAAPRCPSRSLSLVVGSPRGRTHSAHLRIVHPLPACT
jgi:hypothetical protein